MSLPEPDSSELKSLYPDYEQLTGGQQRILGAALALFAERGYASTSTGAIAKVAGVAEGLIFKHFRSKKELFLQLIKPLVLEVFFPLTVMRMQKLLQQHYSDLPSLLEAILRERLDFARRHQRLVRVIIQEVGLHAELTETMCTRFGETIQPFLEKQFAHFCQQGAIRPMAFQTFFRLTVTAFMGYVISRVLLFPDAAWDDDDEIRETVRFVVQGLAA